MTSSNDGVKKRRMRQTSRRNCDGQTDANVGLPFQPRANTGVPHVICVGKSDTSRANVAVLPLKAKAKVRAKPRVTGKELSLIHI